MKLSRNTSKGNCSGSILEELESRVLYSASPTPIPDHPVEEAVTQTPEAEAEFEAFNSFNKRALAPSIDEVSEQGPMVILTSFDNLDASEIAYLMSLPST